MPSSSCASLVVLALALALARGEELARAHVVVTKTLPAAKEGVVQGRPFEILYAVKNVGAEEALDVKVTDDFPADGFALVGGAAAAAAGGAPAARLAFAKLAPGESATARLVLVPKAFGMMRVARAHVSYKYRGGAASFEDGEAAADAAAAAAAAAAAEEDDEDGGAAGRERRAAAAAGGGEPGVTEVQGLSSTPGKVEIFKPEAFARRVALTSARAHSLEWAALALAAGALAYWPWARFKALEAAAKGAAKKAL